jgi:long-subunit fatty acid transport protein
VFAGDTPLTIQLENLSSRGGALILLLGLLLAPARALGQEAAVPLQFNYSDPGARSMGFGGAFVALADDATAAFSNPAGLVQILRPELSLEARHWQYSTPYTEGGRAEGLPSGFGIDSTVGLRTATSDVDITELSFLSFVYPAGNWSFALYRHSLANFEFFSETQGLFGGGTSCCQTRDWDLRAVNDLGILTYGISAAYRVNDRLNLGLGVVYYDASFESNATLFRWDEDTVESFGAPNSYLPERTVVHEKLFFDDTDTALTAGFLWRVSENWSIGGVYRQAPEVSFGVELTAGETLDPGIPPGTMLIQAETELTLPKLYGLGFAYKDPGGRLTVSFQWDRINYSSIVKSLKIDDRIMDDANELHLGAEYVFIGSSPVVALRFGVWQDPDHRMRNNSGNPFAEALVPRGQDEVHFSLGLGLATPRFQIDAAVDIADQVNTLSVSAIYNFEL